MSELTKQTIVKTVGEMFRVESDLGWIREEVECMFDRVFSKKEWDSITLQAFVQHAFTPEQTRS